MLPYYVYFKTVFYICILYKFQPYNFMNCQLYARILLQKSFKYNNLFTIRTSINCKVEFSLKIQLSLLFSK